MLCFGAALSLFYLKTLSRFWFEDDPVSFHVVSRIESPGAIFLDPETLRSLGSNLALVPMLMASLWLDLRLFGVNPLGAYVHNLAVFLATLALFHTLVLRLAGDRPVALAATLVWALLPSTLVVHQWVSARHYMEGLLFALVALLCAQELLRRDGRRSGALAAAIAVSSAASMLCKEVYAALVPTTLLLVGIARRRTFLWGLGLALVAAYTGYRYGVTGLGLAYAPETPLLGPGDTLRALAVLPITWSANRGGYGVYLVLALLTFELCRREGRAGAKRALLFLALLGASLLAIYPVAFAVLHSHAVPGTWYRVSFAIHALLALYGAYLAARLLSRRWQVALLAGLLLVVAPGTEAMRHRWDERMTHAELEARFYLDNPDKLLFSQEEASWFIEGVHDLYGVPQEHYIHLRQRVSDHAREMLAAHSTIWWLRGGRVVREDGLYQAFVQANSRRGGAR